MAKGLETYGKNAADGRLADLSGRSLDWGLMPQHLGGGSKISITELMRFMTARYHGPRWLVVCSFSDLVQLLPAHTASNLGKKKYSLVHLNSL